MIHAYWNCHWRARDERRDRPARRSGRWRGAAALRRYRRSGHGDRQCLAPRGHRLFPADGRCRGAHVRRWQDSRRLHQARGTPDRAFDSRRRLVDRPIRPLFPKGFRNDVQVVITVLSADQENDSDMLGIIGRLRRALASPISRSPGRSAPCASATSTAKSSSTRPRRR